MESIIAYARELYAINSAGWRYALAWESLTNNQKVLWVDFAKRKRKNWSVNAKG